MFITSPYQGWQPLPWHEAPAWAQWAAMDRRGGWFWYEEEPRDEDGYFVADTGRIELFFHAPYPTHWRLSRQHRPDLPASLFLRAEICYACVPA